MACSRRWTRRTVGVAALAAAAALAPGCGGKDEPPPPGPFTGVWRGTATSSAGASTLTLAVTSTPSDVSGTFFDQRSTGLATGTLAGTVRGDAFDFTMENPSCTGAASGSAVLAEGQSLDVGYWSNTSCDAGTVVAGSGTLAWQQPSILFCGDTYTIPAEVAAAVCSVVIWNSVGRNDPWIVALDPGGPTVGLRPDMTRYELPNPGCTTSCTREVRINIPVGMSGTWRYRAGFQQGSETYTSDMTVTVLSP